MKRFVLLLFCTIGLHFAAAQDIRTLVRDDGYPNSDKIDPDAEVYGIPFGTTESEFMLACGNPDGYIRLNSNRNGMMYGKSHLFIFRDGRLSGVYILHGILDGQITALLTPNHEFDAKQWVLVNGITSDTTLSEARRILGSELHEGLQNATYQWFETAKARVEFGIWSTSEGTNWVQHMGDLRIEQK